MNKTDANAAADISLLTRPQLALVFAKDPRTIAKWLDEGMPVAVKGRGGRPSKYNLPDCVRWVIERELQARGVSEGGMLSAQQERAKLDQTRREDLELRLQVRRGELAEVDQVEARWVTIASAIKARMRAIPDAIADQVAAAGVNGPNAVKRLLFLKINDALRELSVRGAPPSGVETAEADEDFDEDDGPSAIEARP